MIPIAIGVDGQPRLKVLEYTADGYRIVECDSFIHDEVLDRYRYEVRLLLRGRSYTRSEAILDAKRGVDRGDFVKHDDGAAIEEALAAHPALRRADPKGEG